MSEAVKRAVIAIITGLTLTVIPGSVVMYSNDQVYGEKIRRLETEVKDFKRDLMDFKKEVYKSKAFD